MLEHRNKRLKLSKLSLHAMILKERVSGTGVDFVDLMQADFIAFVRSEIHEDDYHSWWPETLVYADRFNGAFEIFSRAASRKYLENIFIILDVPALLQVDDLLDKYATRARELPSWQFTKFSPKKLIGRDSLGTKP